MLSRVNTILQLRTIETGEQLFVSGSDILASLEVATAVYQSATGGQVPMTLPLTDRIRCCPGLHSFTITLDIFVFTWSSTVSWYT
jgi:hypothetical protein